MGVFERHETEVINRFRDKGSVLSVYIQTALFVMLMSGKCI